MEFLSGKLTKWELIKSGVHNDVRADCAPDEVSIGLNFHHSQNYFKSMGRQHPKSKLPDPHTVLSQLHVIFFGTYSTDSNNLVALRYAKGLSKVVIGKQTAEHRVHEY